MKKEGENTAELICCVICELDDREQRIIKLRFGIEDGHPRTLLEIGRELKLTAERIRQNELKALRKLRHPSRSERLRTLLSSMDNLGAPSQLFLRAIFGPNWQQYQ